MKIIPKEKIKSEQEKIHTLSERYILEAMNHPFIVHLHYAFQTSSKLYLLVDLMAGVSHRLFRENCFICLEEIKSSRSQWLSFTQLKFCWPLNTSIKGILFIET